MLDTLKTRLLIPSGKCPIELTGVSYDEVLRWISKLSKSSKGGIEYQTSVYRYWAKYFYEFGSKELEEVNSNIAKILNSSATFFDLIENPIEKG